jgi:hypothetical protein
VEPQIGFRDGLWAKPQQRLVAICLVLLVLVLASISRLGNVLTYYFLMMFPPVVLLTAYGIGAWLRAAAGWTVPRLREEPAWHAHSRTILVAGVVVLISLWPARAGYRALLDMPPGPIGAPLEYGWYDAPLPEWVNRLVRDDFWENHGYLMQGGNPVTNYLQYQSLNHFDVAHEVAAFIRQHTRPNETIFGDMDIAPVIALLSNRRLAANIVDTGAMRFATGSLEPESCWRRVSRDRLAYVVTRRPKGDLASVPEMTVLIERDCVLVRKFLGQFPGDLYIYEPRTRARHSRR